MALLIVWVPVVYINSTCTMDYLWALMFLSASFYALITRHFLLSAFLLALSVGCRITFAGMWLPFVLYIWQTESRERMKIIIPYTLVSGLMSVLCFVPVMYVYGMDFFDYSDQFPYPNWPKFFYKISLGVFGLTGLIALAFLWLPALINQLRSKTAHRLNTLHYLSISTIVLYIGIYFILPQKSAYMMSIVPFCLLSAGALLKGWRFNAFAILIAVSPFVFSINLTDPFRGAQYSKAAFTFKMANQEIFIDPLSGLMMSDYTKRINKNAYCKKAIEAMNLQQDSCKVICGWWYNQIITYQLDYPINTNIEPVFYAHPEELLKFFNRGNRIFHLSEQDLYNDLMYKSTQTVNISEELNVGVIEN
jgi:hypothetical protein